MDPDIIFDPKIVPYMISAAEQVQFRQLPTVITPEIVRIWDSTWDCLVNEAFLNKPTGYQKIHNPHHDTVFDDTTVPTLWTVDNSSIGQPRMKFAGGWFTILSKSMLTSFPIPDSFSHYGLEDTYIMYAAHGSSAQQYKVKGAIVCENYFDRDTSLAGKIQLIDRRKEYLDITTKAFHEELKGLRA
jgi:hypothetical protein